MLPDVLNTSSAKPTMWKRQMALASSNVSSLLQIMNAWMASAMISRRSYLGIPNSPVLGTLNIAMKKRPANRQARASFRPK